RRRAAVADALPAEDAGLFEKLRAWRRSRAEQEDVPAFVVLHDSALKAIAASRPESRGQLGEVPGIGEAKLERFGDEILALVAAD
ncbi:MAG: HRDC domain-containing protein, partial [Sandaracinobacteroides sp.]